MKYAVSQLNSCDAVMCVEAIAPQNSAGIFCRGKSKYDFARDGEIIDIQIGTYY